jgi:ABC-type nitrate/sulfonate/bicarbonate transport system permease component
VFVTVQTSQTANDPLLSWLTALTLAMVIAVPLGLLIGRLSLVRAATMPLIEFLRPMPGVALIPLVTVLLGVGAQTKITLAVFAAVWPVLVNTNYAVREVDTHLLDTARAFRLSRPLWIFGVVLPAAGPKIFAGLRMSLSVTLVLVVQQPGDTRTHRACGRGSCSSASPATC